MNGCKTLQSASDIKVGGGSPSNDPAVVKVLGQDFICSGTVVGEMTILTAAHCVESQSLSSLKVVVSFDENGNSVERRFDIAKKFIHPKYRTYKMGLTHFRDREASKIQLKSVVIYDFALLKTDRSLGVQPKNFAMEELESADELSIVGFGKVSSGSNDEQLQFSGKTKLPPSVSIDEKDETVFHNEKGEVVGKSEMIDYFLALRYYGVGVLALRERVTGISDKNRAHTLSGDSGGPLLKRGKILGVTSAGSLVGGIKTSYFGLISAFWAKNFFTEARKRGFSTQSDSNFDCDDDCGERLFPWKKEKDYFMLSEVEVDKLSAEVLCEEEESGWSHIKDYEIKWNTLRKPKNTWKSAPIHLKELFSKNFSIWYLDSRCLLVNPKNPEECLKRAILSENPANIIFDASRDQLAYALCESDAIR